jgi:hypothetical protein
MCRRRREEEPGVAGKEPATCGFTSPIGEASYIGAINPHHVLLVTGMTVACALKRQPFPIMAEIRFGVFAAECELANRAEVTFTSNRLDCTRR